VGVNVAGFDIVNSQPGAPPNLIKGNYIGTDAAGLAPVSNSVGVYINNTPRTTIGGTQAGARHPISAKPAARIHIFRTPPPANVVQGNRIGVNARGQTSFRVQKKGQVFLQQQGVFLDNASGNTIGGSDPGAGNIISGNEVAGVYIFGKSGSS